MANLFVPADVAPDKFAVVDLKQYLLPPANLTPRISAQVSNGPRAALLARTAPIPGAGPPDLKRPRDLPGTILRASAFLCALAQSEPMNRGSEDVSVQCFGTCMRQVGK